MHSLLNGGDVDFTNLGFLAPPGALDALSALGFNLLALADNHAFDLKLAGISNTLVETRRRGLAAAGIGMDLAAAAAPAYLRRAGLVIVYQHNHVFALVRPHLLRRHG